MKKFTLWLLFAFVALVANAQTASVYLRGTNYGWDNGTKLEYNSTEAAYVYTETTPANLAGEFKIVIGGGWYSCKSFELYEKDNYIHTYE